MVEGYKKSEIGVVPKEWDVKPFGDVFKILSNNTLSRDCLNYHSGSIKNIHYGDVLILFPEVLDCTRDDIPYINSDVSLTGMSLNEGDIIISDTAEDETVGKATEIYNKGDINVVSGLHTIPCRTIERKYTSGWWGYYINSKCFHDQLLPYIHGTKVSSIARDSLFKTFVAVPPIEEQNYIVKALRDIDRLIEQSGQLVNKYKLIKEGCLHVMFPNGENKKPEIRISGFDNDWEQRKLGDVVADFYNGQTPSRFKDEYWNGSISWLSSGELNRGHVNQSIEKITEAGRESANLRLIPNGTFVMAITGLEAPGTRGNCAILDFDTTLNQSCMALFPKKDMLTSGFLFQWYRKVGEDYGNRFTQGTKQQSYNAEIIKELDICLPKVDEQKKLSDCLEDLDNLITIHQRKVEKYKMIKQGMIEDLMTGKVRLI